MGNEENKNTNDSLEKAIEIGLSDLFKGDNLFIFIYKKTQKIVSAMYLITSLLSDEEPLKWSLRRKGGQILSDIILFFNTKNESDLDNTKSHILEVLSLLEVGELSRLISPMNSTIIKEEFAVIFKLISGDLKNKFIIPSNFFEIGMLPSDARKPIKGKDERPDFHIGHHKGRIMSFTNDESLGHISGKNREEKDIKLKDRRELILSVVRKNKDVNIRDIKDILADYSLKTIQRDLLNLVAEGVLKKVGERRWSRYQII